MQQNIYGNNIIITEPSSNLRALGRNALTGKWQIAVLAVMVYTLCMQLPPAILNGLFGINVGELYVRDYYSSGYYMGMDMYSDVYNSLPVYSPLSSIYVLLVGGSLQLGVTLFFLAMFRKQAVGVSDIFLGFERFGKSLGLLFFQGLFVFLWSLLLIVPGIIAAIRYSQAFYILADDPDKGIRQCMDESKAMMNGNKAKYFCMELSFIGWILLVGIPESIVLFISSAVVTNWVVSVIVTTVAGLFIVPVVVYISSTQAGFYEILAGHLIKETEPAPVEPKAVSAEDIPRENVEQVERLEEVSQEILSQDIVDGMDDEKEIHQNEIRKEDIRQAIMHSEESSETTETVRETPESQHQEPFKGIDIRSEIDHQEAQDGEIKTENKEEE